MHRTGPHGRTADPRFRPIPSWERVQLARHPKRPHSLDYIQRLITDFEELHGDRGFPDDHSIVAGMGWFEERPVMVVGQQKGRDTKQKFCSAISACPAGRLSQGDAR